MRKGWISCLLIVFGLACTKTPSFEGEKYGATITLNQVTPVSQILADPQSHLGKKVLVQGEIVDVCAKAGCWLEIAGEQPGQKIKVKVNDGEIVFPTSARGKMAQVEGEVYEIKLTHEQAIGYFQHIAEEQGVPFDSSSVTGPTTIYQIKGLAAVIAR
ncbi:MAG: DUF4920 domain-containing protein [candidate division KSB1 bacterium]|nr:DUF4920 domain-containing protein [candidate division KSB1 bacterium]MDZ7286071.1 DUF4920 domain-containing protein [candidate division KSB1 bacterium]MDZ7353543.1 DUF4920 domain-containing protein [candidate division KSB1 bacterium]MDZ7382118.1 DUF4920 domain-containing protein [candidate division KSB1 bacterium]MDZ7396755.1 DUF4920 domain-containing protein [candidate division KSB1 bacterium]